MCDPVLIAAILEELGYLDDKNEKKKDEDHDEKSSKDTSKNSGEKEE